MSHSKPPPLAYATPPRGAMPRGLWLIVIAALLAVFIIAPLSRKLRTKPRRPGNQCATVIQAVDATDGSPLAISVAGPPLSGEDPWAMTFQPMSDISRMRLTWKDVDDLPIRVSSEGYIEQALVLNGKTPPTVVVRLQKQ